MPSQDRKAYDKIYHEANKDKIKAYQEANKDKIKENKKAYYEANKDKMKAYREANKDKMIQKFDCPCGGYNCSHKAS